jgi:transposase
MDDDTLADSFREAIGQAHTLTLGALPLFYPILDTLGLRDIINELRPTKANVDLGLVALTLVLNRLMAPQPLCWVNRWLAQTVLPAALDLSPAKMYDQRLGRGLQALYPHLGEIWARLVVRAVQVWHIDLSVLHWDITSFYFTGAYTESELLRRGYSRDKRPDMKQVNLEADVAHGTRVPVGYRVLPGQTADITCPPGHLQALLRLLNRPELADLNLHPILVSDGKMITPQAISDCHYHRFFYLGPLSATNAVRKLLRSVSEDELAAHPLTYRPKRHRQGSGTPQAQDTTFVPYQGVWRPYRVTVPPPTDQPEAPKKVHTDRALVVWSAGKARLDVGKRRTYLKRLLDELDNIRRQLNRGRYAERDYVVERIGSVRRGNPAKNLVWWELLGTDGELSLKFHLDRDRVAAMQMLDGRYALGTNADHLSADQALRLFKAQDDAEKQFQALKSPLAVRPVYLHTDERIEGLVFVTLVALLVRALLALQCQQAGVSASVDRILVEFAPWSAVELSLTDGSQVRQVATPTEFQAEVMKLLGVPECKRYLTTLTR